MILTRLTRWALRAAARRWPADLRAELLHEWLAEIAYLEGRPGTTGRRLGFALSLLAAPPVRDAAGVPRGWAEARSGLSPALALVFAGLFGLGVSQMANLLFFPVFDLLGMDDYGWIWPAGQLISHGVALALWCVPVGRWLGRRLPMNRDGRLGVTGPAVLAPVAMLPALLVPASGGEGPLIPSLSTLIGLVTWTVLTALIGRTMVGAGRTTTAGLALGAVPLAALVSAALATVPLLIQQGRAAAGASLLLGNLDLIEPDRTGMIVFTGALIGPFIAYGWLAVLYGRRAAAAPDRPIRFTEPVAEQGPADLPPVLLGAGLTALLAGVLTWAYTVTYLTPAMPLMSAVAPMPGGDGELYLWVAELRWTAILLAALGVLTATANRRSAGRAAILLGAGLLGTEAVLLPGEFTGASGLRIALLAAAVVIAAAWSLAGHPVAGAAVRVVRVRVTAAAITAVAIGPMLYAQSTPAENHEFMPIGLPITTAAVAVALVLLGTGTAVATSRYPLPWPVAALLVAGPAAGLAGLGVFLGNGVNDTVAGTAILAGLPLAVLLAALLRIHRPRRRGRTALLWTMFALAGVPGTMVLLYAGVGLLMFVPNILFSIDSSGYPADGLSVVPGSALLILPAAIWFAGRSGGTAPLSASEDPVPVPNSLSGQDPEPVV
ncbi:hypothetical protein [Actinoplanes couchii]|uniref:Integral membrane protein n=1 Tax=Actinoplanes couchii TaxID=403638 RepID=A0ABQ3X0B7_9ACTN|nr:hypothetical protein [Actinoplanes couchii]MDR6316278.1 hypothetical protein [Actinoplanes couchii]GID51893.1 hypothetical protein Aco03nite_002970 [Actinoplanes couchii]